jgi:hypothetical protein
MQLRVFQRQVELQCRAVISAAAAFQEAMNGPYPQDLETASKTWIAIQNLLNASAMISKACWGQRGKHKKARKPLRDSLGMTDSNPFRDPGMRNNFEHYDERIDAWWRLSKTRNYFDMAIAPQASVVPPAIRKRDMFRVLDPVTGTVVFWGQKFALAPLVFEARRILPIAHAEGVKPHLWVPRSSANTRGRGQQQSSS